VKGDNAELLDRVLALASVKSAKAAYLDSSSKSQAEVVTQALTPVLSVPTTLYGILPGVFEDTVAPISG
jgi:hypothetical protein